MVTLTRTQLVGTLQRALEQLDAVDAAWEGGSAAFDACDEMSDVDVVAVVADDAIAPTFVEVEAALAALSPVALRVDVPGTVGFTQKFFRLRDASEFLVVDLVLIRRSDPLLFREVELHGRGRCWFDRRGVLVESHLDSVVDAAQARERVPVLAKSFAMFQHIVTKELRRGRAVDALVFYQAMTWRPLVEAVRLLHGPQRRIFGPRYLTRDLPADVCARLQALAFVNDLTDLGVKHQAAQKWFEQCIRRLEQHAPGSGVPAD